jgi:hypothetical protein
VLVVEEREIGRGHRVREALQKAFSGYLRQYIAERSAVGKAR